MKLEFRNLNENEIAVKAIPSQGGVKLLLYKDARCDQNILDETVGPTGWQRRHSRDNANCIVSIYDTDLGQWVEKEDTGTENELEKDKSLASSSFKRACTNWGIGRELYTSPEMFVPQEYLMSPATKGQNITCDDRFSVQKIKYNGKEIVSVLINVIFNGVTHRTIEFTQDSASTANVEKVAPVRSAATTQNKPAENKQKGNERSAAPNQNSLLRDDEIILMGNCKGKTFGECKNTDIFKSFLKWAKNASSNYSDPKQKDQFERIKKLAAAI